MRRRIRHGLVVIALLVCATFALAQSGPIRYVYDELGRLIGVIDQNGDAASYHYDAVGNLTGITRTSAGAVAIFEFTPNAAAIGSSVTLYGVGFSATPAQNAVTINGTAATVTSASTTKLVIIVPAGAATGALAVITPLGSASATPSFVVASGPGAPSISGISPTIGLAGTAVTVTGFGFDPLPANDKVSFNLSYGSPTSITSTQVAVPVPSGGTSGPITVATPYGSAASAQDFFVPPSPFVVADVAVTDRMTFGADKVVTLSTAGKIALVLFDAAAGQRPGLKISSVTTALSTVSVRDPYARTLGSVNVGGGGGFIEPVRAPVASTYTVLVDPAMSYTGSVTLRLYDVPADVEGTIVPSGTPASFSIAVPGQNGRWTFSGTAGERVSAWATNSTISGLSLSILNPDGTLLAGGSAFIDTQVLPTTGSYAVFANPPGFVTGAATVNLYAVPADATGTLTAGGSAATINIAVPGQGGRFTFSGASGQRVSLTVNPGPLGSLTIRKPDETVLTTGSVGVLTSFIEPFTLPSTGTYAIDVNPMNAATGNVTLTLHDVPADVTGTIAAGGSAVTVTTTTPGQNGSLTFSGTAGQRVSLSLSSGPGGSVAIRRASGTSLTSTSITVLAGFIEPVTLPATEIYTVFVDYSGNGTGSVTVQLFDVPADVTGSVTVGGGALGVTTTTAGQNALITFSGTSGQQVTVRMTGNTMGSTTVKLLKPDGSQLTISSSSASSFNLSTQTLPTTGTYTIVIDPTKAATGSISVSVTNP